MKTELYSKDAKDQIRVWTIETCGDGILMKHGVHGGRLQEKFEAIDEGLASRSIEEQIESRFDSRIGKKLDSGYCMTIDEAMFRERTNSLGFSRPMLAQRFDKINCINYDDMYIQHKYDGNRLLIKNENGENIAYSRQGKIVDSIPEILDSITIPEGTTIDGEIYCHGESLQTIVSWVKRRQDDSRKLRYHVYDIMTDDYYSDRLNMLRSFDLGHLAEVVPTYKYDNRDTIKNLLDESIKSGYEGLILRQNTFGYESKRSKSLIKVKKFFDGEFLIKGVHLSKDEVPVLELITNDGVEFKATMPGSFEEKDRLYENGVVGCHARVEYSILTKDGKPFHPVATHILNDKDELK